MKTSYIFFDLELLAIDDVISSDIYIKNSSSYSLILEAQMKLTEKLYALLKKQENLYVLDNIHTRNKESNVHIIDDDQHVINLNSVLTQVKRNKNDVSKTIALLYDANKQFFDIFLKDENNKIDLFFVNAIVESIIFLMQKNTHYLKEIMPLIQGDYKIPTHSFNVTLYALHIGTYLNFEPKQLLQLGQSALLHDVGKKKICSIVNKKGPLTPEEIQLTKEHSQYSIDILKENNIIDNLILDAVKGHHERYDASGYPERLREDCISDFASILAICDVFDALTVYKPNRKGYTTFEALKIMLKDAPMRNKFNDAYIRLLLI